VISLRKAFREIIDTNRRADFSATGEPIGDLMHFTHKIERAVLIGQNIWICNDETSRLLEMKIETPECFMAKIRAGVEKLNLTREFLFVVAQERRVGRGIIDDPNLRHARALKPENEIAESGNAIPRDDKDRSILPDHFFTLAG
jgi:hypothetical protein